MQCACEPSCDPKQGCGAQNEKEGKDYSQHRSFVRDGKRFAQPRLDLIYRANHAECVDERPKCENDNECRNVFSPRQITDADRTWVIQRSRGGRRSGDATLSWGQAWTQSRQKV